MTPKTVVILGAGAGISGAFARRAHAAGARLLLAARRPDRLAELAAATGAEVMATDVADPAQIAALFERADAVLGPIDVMLYNPSARVRAPFIDLDPTVVLEAWKTTAWGAMVAAQQAARRMLPRGRGAILFTGATASVKGVPHSATFAMGKFALRGLAQSMARELAPQGVHVAHFVIDGAVGPDDPAKLDPDAIAESYWHVACQPATAWTWELELRPNLEKF